MWDEVRRAWKQEHPEWMQHSSSPPTASALGPAPWEADPHKSYVKQATVVPFAEEPRPPPGSSGAGSPWGSELRGGGEEDSEDPLSSDPDEDPSVLTQLLWNASDARAAEEAIAQQRREEAAAATAAAAVCALAELEREAERLRGAEEAAAEEAAQAHEAAQTQAAADQAAEKEAIAAAEEAERHAVEQEINYYHIWTEFLK